MRGLYDKVNYLVADGKITQARDVAKEILRLNSNDNLGARYILMAIYAYLEDEESANKLYEEYPEESFSMLLSMCILYYKLGNDKKAKSLLKKVNKLNKNFVEYLTENVDEEPEPLGYYSKGDISEILMYFEIKPAAIPLTLDYGLRLSFIN